MQISRVRVSANNLMIVSATNHFSITSYHIASLQIVQFILHCIHIILLASKHIYALCIISHQFTSQQLIVITAYHITSYLVTSDHFTSYHLKVELEASFFEIKLYKCHNF